MKKSLLLLLQVFIVQMTYAQCLTNTCETNITVNRDPGICGAVVNYTTPTALDTCISSSHDTFSFTGAVQHFVIPAGVTSVSARLYGAQGGANWVNNTNYGGYSQGDIPVTPGDTLFLYVGEQPTTLTGGFNGGGTGEGSGIGGGGASDIRMGGDSLTHRIIVAGGAGGAGFWAGQHVVGGEGGGLVGGEGYRNTIGNPGGGGGKQNASDSGTCAIFNNPTAAGGFGFGGSSISCGCEGYGGGGGWYGGGGSGNCRGGGGGSGYLDPILTNDSMATGVNIGHGKIILDYTLIASVTQTAGLPSGSTFPFGVTTNTFLASNGVDSNTCTFTVTVNPITNTISTTACDTYTSPSGKVWTSSNTYMDTVVTGDGCDSILTINLTVNNSSSASITATACDTYTSPSGKVWTMSNTYMDTIPNALNCDSIITVNLTVNNSSTGSITTTVCDTYTSPSGKVWTTSNTYMDTIPNFAGCDSIITVNLTVNNSTTGTITTTVCDTYTSPSGQVWGSTNTYMDTIPNMAGCDSIITINLTVNNSTSGTITTTVCDTYTSPSGHIWDSTNTYLDTIPNMAGCDSVITVNLTILSSSSSTIDTTVCDSYTSPSGLTWDSTSIYVDTIPNAAGCDSIMTINLTVLESTTATFTEVGCDSLVSPSGKVWTMSNTYMDTIPNAAGCDSIMTFNVTINTHEAIITLADEVLTANLADSYQWIHCDSDTAIPGAIDSTFAPITGGNYAVVSSLNNCVDTSNCETVVLAGLKEISTTQVSVFPNPTNGEVTLDFGKQFNTVAVEVFDITGKLILTNTYSRKEKVTMNIEGETGVYLIKVNLDNKPSSIIRVIKE